MANQGPAARLLFLLPLIVRSIPCPGPVLDLSFLGSFLHDLLFPWNPTPIALSSRLVLATTGGVVESIASILFFFFLLLPRSQLPLIH